MCDDKAKEVSSEMKGGTMKSVLYTGSLAQSIKESAMKNI